MAEKAKTLVQRVGGVVPPVVTPLTEKGDFDPAAMERLIEFQLNAGVHGIFAMGTTGEVYVLPDAVRRAAVESAAQCLAGRQLFYVGVGDSNPERVLANAEHAAMVGADVLVLISPPSYDYSPVERLRYFREMAAKLPLPVLAYNIPQINKNPVTLEMLEELVSMPNVIGMKESQGDGVKSAQELAMLAAHQGFRWFEGADILAAQSLLLGAQGIVNGGCNVFPKLYMDVYNAARANDNEALRKHHRHLLHANTLSRLDAANSSSIGSFIKCTKYALHLMGLCEPHLAFPSEPLGADARKRVERLLVELTEQYGSTTAAA